MFFQSLGVGGEGEGGGVVTSNDFHVPCGKYMEANPLFFSFSLTR